MRRLGNSANSGLKDQDGGQSTLMRFWLSNVRYLICYGWLPLSFFGLSYVGLTHSLASFGTFWLIAALPLIGLQTFWQVWGVLSRLARAGRLDLLKSVNQLFALSHRATIRVPELPVDQILDRCIGLLSCQKGWTITRVDLVGGEIVARTCVWLVPMFVKIQVLENGPGAEVRIDSWCSEIVGDCGVGLEIVAVLLNNIQDGKLEPPQSERPILRRSRWGNLLRDRLNLPVVIAGMLLMVSPHIVRDQLLVQSRQALARGDNEMGLTMATLAERLDSRDEETRLTEAVCFKKLGCLSEAENLLQEVIDGDAECVSAHVEMADVRRMQRKLQAASAEVIKAESLIEHSGIDTDHLNYVKSLLMLDEGDLKGALEKLDEYDLEDCNCRLSFGNSYDLKAVRARVYQCLGEVDKAAEDRVAVAAAKQAAQDEADRDNIVALALATLFAVAVRRRRLREVNQCAPAEPPVRLIVDIANVRNVHLDQEGPWWETAGLSVGDVSETLEYEQARPDKSVMLQSGSEDLSVSEVAEIKVKLAAAGG